MSVSSLPLNEEDEDRNSTDPFEEQNFSSPAPQKVSETKDKSGRALIPKNKLGRINNSSKSLVQSFVSNSALYPDNPVRAQVQYAANQSEGVLAQRTSAAEVRNSMGLFKRAGSSKSMSFRRVSRQVKTKRPELHNSDELRLKALEERIVQNSKNRDPVEDTSLMENGELIEKYVYQLRRSNHGKILKQRWRDYACVVAKGQTFNQESSKPCQDSIGVAHWKDYECVVVCDGHGKTGEEVAWQVSNWLPGRILKHVMAVTTSNENKDIPDEEVFAKATLEADIIDLFHECDRDVIWSEEILNFRWVKIIGGKFKGLMAQVCSTVVEANEILPPTLEGGEEEIPVCVFMNGDREFRNPKKFGMFSGAWEPPNRQMELPIEQQLIPRKFLLCERDFYGGGTCLMFVRNHSTNQFRFATAGDSRLLYVPPSKTAFPKDEAAVHVRARNYDLPKRFSFSCFSGKGASDPNKAVLSVEHNIHDLREFNRLEQNFDGCFIVGDGVTSEAMEGYFYSNALFPYTGGLTPTRGFGDRLYYGSGYTCTPEVSQVYTIEPGSLILGGSDGIFDDAVWGEEMCGLVHEAKELQKQKLDPEEIVKVIQEETTRRCFDWNLFRVDDISLFCLVTDEK